MGRKTILVSRLVVDHNRNTGEVDPVFTVIDQDGTEYKTSNILILGSSEVKYDPMGEEGKRVWIETFSKVVINELDLESGHPTMATI